MRATALRTPLTVAAGICFFSQFVSPVNWTPAVRHMPRPIVQWAPRHPRIALTFDDGPHPKMTERLLNLLAAEHVPATFFVVGKMADRYPYLVQEIAAGGHEVSNHSYTHPRFAHLSPQDALNELSRTRNVIRRLTGKDTPYYRPPGGRYSPAVARAASHAGYRMVLWSTLTKDVEGASPALIERRVLNGAQDGGIVLMHSGLANTLQALPDVIASLRAQGYEFVTVSTLLTPNAGVAPHATPTEPRAIAHAPIAPVNAPRPD